MSTLADLKAEAKRLGVMPKQGSGSGKNGNVLKKDIVAALAQHAPCDDRTLDSCSRFKYNKCRAYCSGKNLVWLIRVLHPVIDSIRPSKPGVKSPHEICDLELRIEHEMFRYAPPSDVWMSRSKSVTTKQLIQLVGKAFGRGQRVSLEIDIRTSHASTMKKLERFGNSFTLKPPNSVTGPAFHQREMYDRHLLKLIGEFLPDYQREHIQIPISDQREDTFILDRYRNKIRMMISISFFPSVTGT
jgi:hypothetical protein